MIAWLFWPSLVLLIYAGGCWLIARYWPRIGLAAASLGDMAPGLPDRGWKEEEEMRQARRWYFERYSKPRGEEPVAATPPTLSEPLGTHVIVRRPMPFRCTRGTYPEDGC